MILLNEFVKLDVSPEFWNLFLVVIQLGAILAVVILYWKTIWPFKRVTTKAGKSKIVKYGFRFSGSELILLGTGMLVAFLVSMVIIAFLMNYIRKHDFKVFGVYRIILGALVLLYFLVMKAPVY